MSSQKPRDPLEILQQLRHDMSATVMGAHVKELQGLKEKHVEAMQKVVEETYRELKAQMSRLQSFEKDRVEKDLLFARLQDSIHKCLAMVLFDLRERKEAAEVEKVARLAAELAGRITVHAGRMSGALEEGSVEQMAEAFRELDQMTFEVEVVQ